MSDCSPQIVLVITGGIAAYKVLELIRLLRKKGIKVLPVMTHHAKKFVTPLSVAVLAEQPVHSEFDDLEEGYGMGHIELTRQADLVVVCPASADILAACAMGFAGSLASCLLLASSQQLVMFPAMNPTMWAHPAVKHNVKTLKNRGVDVVSPAFGLSACHEEGIGRLPDIDLIFAKILARLQKKTDKVDLSELHILITAGPTREALDPVRYLSNHSSGLQGYALARAAKDCGAKVTLVAGPTALMPPSDGIHVCQVQSANEMLEACRQALPVDVMIACAAVCDVQLEKVPTQKIPKEAIHWQFTKTPDVVKEVATGKQRPKLVIGFSAETGTRLEMIERAKAKLVKKNCDWIVANNVKIAMNKRENEAIWLTRENETEDWPRMEKFDLAIHLMEKIAKKMTISAKTNKK